MLSDSLSFTSLLAAVLAFGACGDNHAARPDAGSAPADSGPSSDAGSGTAPGVGLVVVNSDFASTSISLLDGSTGQVTKGDCIDSGAHAAGVTQPLSGDVVVPSWPQPGDPVLLIDRKTAALTWLDPATCAPTHQLDVSTGFAADPHDVVAVSATKAYVTRYAPNPTPTADPIDRDDGDDLLIIDPSVPAVTGQIKLASYAVPVTGAMIKARPDRARLIGTTLFVALNEISDDFSTLAHGRVIAIDTTTDQVTATIDLPELADCVDLSYIEASKTLAVLCTGDFSAADATPTSGIAYIDVTASPPVEVRHQPASAFGGRALGAYSSIANNGALGFAVTPGVFNGTPHDQLWSFDVASGQTTPITEASDSFVYGTVLVDPGHQRLYLTDALDSTPRVQVYDYSSGTTTHKAAIATDATHSLPPRQIEWY
ncbi:MAG TPA: hypothetical protein VH165_06835 [Kofleriaceae bacterium]|jgi:hypothetical protein|nr:hypothetical protein [Kofleriaceae bacterium]